MYRKILVAYDGSPGAEKALTAAIDLCRYMTAEIHVVAVEERLPITVATVDEIAEEKERSDTVATQLLERAQRRAAEEGVAIETELRAGHPARTIVDVARAGNFDLVVLGHSGRSQAWTMFLGTTAEKVSRHVSCSTLIVR